MKLKMRKESEGGILYKYPDDYFFISELGYDILLALQDSNPDEFIDNIAKKHNLSKLKCNEYLGIINKIFDDLAQNGSPIDPGKLYRDIIYIKRNNLRSPIQANIEVTNKCNIFCEHCYNRVFYKNASENDLSLDEIESILDKIVEANVFVLLIAGGEPFLRDDIFDIINYSKDKGLVVGISTNGTLLDSANIKKLVNTDIDEIQVSLDGWDRASYLSIKGSDMFDKVLNSIELMKAYGLPVHINNVVTKDRLIHIDDMKNISTQLKIPATFSIYMPNNQNKNYKYILDKDDLKSYCDDYEDFLNCYKYNPKLFVTIDSRGNVYPCVNSKYEQFCMGNLLHERLPKIWGEYHNKNNEGRNCANCKKIYA